MNIAVNARFLIKDKLEGIGWFTNETLKRITKNNPQHTFYFFFDRKFDDSFIFSDNIIPVVINPPARHPLLWYVWFEYMVPYYLKKHKCDYFISQDGYLSLKTKIPTHLTIHDLAFEHFDDHVSKLTNKYYKHFTPLYAEKASRIATVSNFSASDISEKYGINSEKIDVIPNGFNNRFKPVEKIKQKEIQDRVADGCPYFLFAGTIQPRKNLENLLKAYEHFRENNDSNIKLLVAGRKGWKYQEAIDIYESMKFKNDVIFLGHLTLDKLVDVMGAATALFYISLFEGFGIPILESFASGVPVVTSDRSSMPEVGGDAAIIVDPYNIESIADSMKKIAVDNKFVEELVSKGIERVKMFSWDITADKLWESVSLSMAKDVLPLQEKLIKAP
ncbi:MAG: glycosyltransferase family 1 protein [Chitinophagaceae bacterium]|nr:MAG: glycosyltransferase family 1 protein [Chitinophagaceae bacterium]